MMTIHKITFLKKMKIFCVYVQIERPGKEDEQVYDIKKFDSLLNKAYKIDGKNQK